MKIFSFYFSPKGRIGRQLYWFAVISLSAAFAAVIAVADKSANPEVLLLLLVLLLWGQIAVSSKRLRDRGRTVWLIPLWIGASFVPVANYFMGLWAFVELGCLPGKTSSSPPITPKSDIPPIPSPRHPVPSLSNLEPSEISASDHAQTIRLTGTNIVPGAVARISKVGGIQNFTKVLHIQGDHTAEFASKFRVSAIEWSVLIENPGGIQSNCLILRVVAPVPIRKPKTTQKKKPILIAPPSISSVLPKNILASDHSQKISLAGSGFKRGAKARLSKVGGTQSFTKVLNVQSDQKADFSTRFKTADIKWELEVVNPDGNTSNSKFLKIAPAGIPDDVSCPIPAFSASPDIQDQLDQKVERLDLVPTEYAGPFIIKSSVFIDGRNSTLHSRQAPVIDIQCGKVHLKNLFVESLQDHNRQIAIRVSPSAVFSADNVFVAGCVEGVPGEEGDWLLPKTLQFTVGEGEVSSVHYFEVEVPVPCSLISSHADIEITPSEITSPGRHQISVNIVHGHDFRYAHGYFRVKTKHLLRRIPYTASRGHGHKHDNSSGTKANEFLPESIHPQDSSPNRRRVVRQQIEKLGSWVSQNSSAEL